MGITIFGYPLTPIIWSGGSWEAELPATNAATQSLAEVARTTNTDAASSVLLGDQVSARAVSVVAIKRHNISAAATWRIRVSANSDLSSPLYDSGLIDCWPYQWAVGELPSGHPNASTRRFTQADIDALNPEFDLVHVLPTEVSARYVGVNIVDTANPDGYVELARALIAPAFSFGSYLSSATVSYDDRTLVGTTEGSGRVYGDRPVARVLDGLYDIASANSTALWDSFTRALRQSGQCYVVLDRDATTTLQSHSFLANPKSMSATARKAAGYGGIPFTFIEVV